VKILWTFSSLFSDVYCKDIRPVLSVGAYCLHKGAGNAYATGKFDLLSSGNGEK